MGHSSSQAAKEEFQGCTRRKPCSAPLLSTVPAPGNTKLTRNPTCVSHLVTRSASEFNSRPLAIGCKSNWAAKVSQLADSPTGHLKNRKNVKERGGGAWERGYSPKYCLASRQGAPPSVGDNVARHWRPGRGNQWSTFGRRPGQVRQLTEGRET